MNSSLAARSIKYPTMPVPSSDCPIATIVSFTIELKYRGPIQINPRPAKPRMMGKIFMAFTLFMGRFEKLIDLYSCQKSSDGSVQNYVISYRRKLPKLCASLLEASRIVSIRARPGYIAQPFHNQ